MNIFKKTSIEKVSMKNMELSLLASGDGTEVIHHKLYMGTRWAMVPEEGWKALEHITILSGKLAFNGPDGEVILEPGDSFNACPVKNHTIFTAQVETEFLYITSQPQFHLYSNSVKDMMELTVRVEQKDGYTSDHCDRIKELSMMVGKEIGLSPDDVYILNLAAFLHDIGKTKVPDEILNKPTKLTDEEFEIVKQHTTWGKMILQETKFPALVKAAEIVVQHHERYDGKGYPNQLKGEDIDIKAAIISVVDAFDAMTTDRIYRKGMDVKTAIHELEKNKGSMFHPQVVDIFLSIIQAKGGETV